MTGEDMAAAAALGIAETGIEGTWASVACSTAGDWPSLGVSQWEGERADALLAAIPGGEAYARRAWTALTAADRAALAALLDSPAGRMAQMERLMADARRYVDELTRLPTLGRPRCVVYAAMWCPTSEAVVRDFLESRAHRCDLGSLEEVHHLFRTEYARAADAEAWRTAYEARADTTYAYTRGL